MEINFSQYARILNGRVFFFKFDENCSKKYATNTLTQEKYMLIVH